MFSNGEARRLEEKSCPLGEDENGEEVICSGVGKCQNGVCICGDEYLGDACQYPCPAFIDENENPHICNDKGTCYLNSGVEAVCNCTEGYYGDICDLQCPGLLEDGRECNGNGECEVIDVDVIQCICKEGFYGVGCENECVVGDNGKVCSGHGSCVDGCKCDSGYYGDDSSKSCPGLLVLGDSVHECNGNGVCNPDTLTCSCSNTLYEDPGCSCGEKTCGGHGSCNSLQKCSCEEKYWLL